MIRTTYRGRELKILKARQAGHVRQFINGQIINHGWPGTEEQAVDNLRRQIDLLDAKGPGASMYCTSPYWWAPGTYSLDQKGHAVPLDSSEPCTFCRSLAAPPQYIQVTRGA